MTTSNDAFLNLIPIVRESNLAILHALQHACSTAKSQAMGVFSLNEEQADMYARLTPMQIQSMATKNNIPLFSVSDFPKTMVEQTECHAGLGALALLLKQNTLPAITPFMVAVILDGSMTRKIKINGFTYLSPVSFNIARHAIIPLVFLPLLYLIAPVPITPLFVPFWALLIAMPMMMLIANAQRMSA